MDRPKSIFLAFAGQPIEQAEAIFEIQDGYECWNLKNFKRDDFIEALKKKIAPINGNVLKYYCAETAPHNIGGITEKQFGECSWGLLIPDGREDVYAAAYAETIFLLNLYSPTFLRPIFYGSDMGIRAIAHDEPPFLFAVLQNQSHNFKTKDFVVFFKTLLPQSQYGTWQLDCIQKWGKEDWRLFVAGWLYSGLKDYENSKNSFGWQRESADMAAILEALFTAGDFQNEEVGYRLRKRMAALLSWRFPDIEKEVKDLYTQRSAFVHGSFFAQIEKDTRHSYNNLPSPDFNLLYKQKEYVRLALISYLHLAKLLSEQPYEGNATVINALEEAIINIALRDKLTSEVRDLFSLMPTPSFKMF